MKKILFIATAMLLSISASAQVMKVMKGDEVVATYTAEQADKVVFVEFTPVTSVSLSLSTAELVLGGTDAQKTTILTATVNPEDATDTSLTWTSSDETVATVTEAGVVTALKAGTATIKATANDGSEKYAECTVTVKQLVTSVSLNKTETEINVGENETLTATVNPEDATDKALTWTSSEETIATVSETGVVTAVKAGTVTITATAKDGSGKSATCTVTVKEAGDPAHTGASFNEYEEEELIIPEF